MSHYHLLQLHYNYNYHYSLNFNFNLNFNYTTATTTTTLHYITTTTTTTLHYTATRTTSTGTTTSSTTLQLQLQLQLQLRLQLQRQPRYTTPAHTTFSSCGRVDHCNHSKKNSSNHVSVHQWNRSAIHVSQQLTSLIVVYLCNFHHCLVRYYWCIKHHHRMVSWTIPNMISLRSHSHTVVCFCANDRRCIWPW